MLCARLQWLSGRKSACNAGATGLILGSERSPGGVHGNPFQYSCLENPRQRSLVGYSPWGHKELDTTEVTSTYVLYGSWGAADTSLQKLIMSIYSQLHVQ